ncbi:hypothetical protein [Streptomyces sp. NBC_01361]|uniref:hypothetical protein n=1 Tax=Streptomyces sp. NBC_01361 TaxID=2903838 RepID=UPI002E35CD47|nr:hypothetical protein [Streptomyces sp. NBC_01361]
MHDQQTLGPPVVITLAVAAGGAWAMFGLWRLSASLWLAAVHQDMTWHAHRQPCGGSDADSSGEEHRRMLIQMVRVEERVAAFASETGMADITIAVMGGRIGMVHEASALQTGRRGHVAVGSMWLSSEYTATMPYILEHELAHLKSQDSRNRVFAGTTCIVPAMLSAGLLPMAEAAVALAGLGLGWVVYRWWSELACDRAAAGRRPLRPGGDGS